MNAEEKQALIERCKTISAWRDKYGDFANVMLPAIEAQEIAKIALAALRAQPRYQIQKKPSYGRESVWIDVASREEAETNVLHGYRWRMVYDCPAPAVSLAELVLDEDDSPVGFIAWYERHFATQPYKGASHVTDCENAWCAAILRNIEGNGTTKSAAPEVE